MSSKEIAISTGLSPQTVDTYVKAAMARLGVSNRREAARILASWEASQKLGSPPPPVVEAPRSVEAPVVVEGDAGAGWLLPPPLGGRINDLRPGARIQAVLHIAVVSAASVLAIALLVAGVLRTFR
jgi:hypothetical protein